MASNEEMRSETEGEEGEAAQAENQDQDHPEDQNHNHPEDQGLADPGQGSSQDEDHDEEQRAIEDDVQADDGEDPAEEMLVGLLPNMTEDQA